ncbi:hypothetical protein LVJ94_27320 [Pendulispora rubella]|uniref:NnrS family protein n=1 Tax=Pendulispora rubella TaxID=2741070 RepID=A0ABZ2KPN1_9BACT
MEGQLEEQAETSPMARLLHRWFVEYNPFYLCSATLVLVGTMIWSRGLAQEGNLYGSLGVAAVAELYAVALLGGAALLVRIGQRRPAVLLALLTVVYQGDLTLHTETCAYLGTAGGVASAIWLVVFVAKLRALAWVFQIRPSARSMATAIVGALGLALIPRLLHVLEPNQLGACIGIWLFAMLTLHEGQGAVSLVPLDAWGTTVLRRVLRATWLIWLGLAVGHVTMWSTAQTLHLAPMLPAAALLAVRWIRRESRIWLLVGAVLVLAACFLPDTFALHAVVAAMALGARAWPRLGADAAATASPSPYRTVEASPPRGPDAAVVVALGDAARMRLFVAAIAASYLAVWTLGWSGGPWPAHAFALDLAMILAMVLVAWRARTRIPAVPPVMSLVHGVLAAGLVPMPHSLVAWGSTIIAMGFALLVASLATSYGLRNASITRPPTG